MTYYSLFWPSCTHTNVVVGSKKDIETFFSDSNVGDIQCGVNNCAGIGVEEALRTQVWDAAARTEEYGNPITRVRSN